MDQIRNFKDFLRLYNVVSDACFRQCASVIEAREVSSQEAFCIDTCAQKFINANSRIMDVFMEVQAVIVQRRIEEMNAAQAQIEEQQQQEQQKQDQQKQEQQQQQ